MSMNRLIDKENVVCAYNGISFCLKEGILTYGTTFVNIMLSDINKSQKDKYFIILFI